MDLFSSYLVDRKQYINYDMASPLKVWRLHGEVLRDQLILIPTYFFSQKDLEVLFNVVNNELDHIKNWFSALTLVHSRIHKLGRKDDIPFRLLVLKKNKVLIERTSSIKFHGALIDEHLMWNLHIHFLQSKVLKEHRTDIPI